MKACLALVFVLSACGSVVEPAEPSLTVTRLQLPDSSQAPFELTVQTEHVVCAQLDCPLDLALPLAPTELQVLDALGNQFTLPVQDLSSGTHVVQEPIAPEAGVFLPYTLEYAVVR